MADLLCFEVMDCKTDKRRVDDDLAIASWPPFNSYPESNITSLLMDVNSMLWTKCPLNGLKIAKEFLHLYEKSYMMYFHPGKNPKKRSTWKSMNNHMCRITEFLRSAFWSLEKKFILDPVVLHWKLNFIIRIKQGVQRNNMWIQIHKTQILATIIYVYCFWSTCAFKAENLNSTSTPA